MKKIIILLMVCGWAVIAPSVRHVFAEPMDKIVAVVNSDVITEEELDIYIKVAGMESDEKLKGDPKDQRRVFLDHLVEDRLIYQEAERQGLKAADEAIEERIKDMKSRAGSERVFEEALRSQGLSLNDLRKKLREQFVVYELVQRQVKQKAQVSPKEIAEYFDEHRETYLMPETAVVDSIFVENREGVAQVQAALAAGKGFTEVEAELSKKSNIELIRRGQFKKELEDFVFGLTPEKPSDPFPVDGGFYIFFLKEIKPPSQQSVSEVKDTIKSQLEAEKTHKAMREFVESLKDKAYISLRET